ncbi:hypothetical protein 162322388 [Organic Lake phycodnavirus 1]|jgi:hypothetical protein|nr:hypothetical protein 162322388 [Organic Lake phycodnavirus 1]
MFEHHRRHFYNPHFKIHTPCIKKRAKEQEKVYDKLFYAIYHKLNERKISLDKYNETIEKINVIEKLEYIKLKHKDKILEDLQSKNIPLHCLNALCYAWNINIVWYSEYFFYESIVKQDEPIYYLSHNYEWTNTMDTNKIKIVDFFKPLKSISYYKLDELKQMGETMNIDGKKKSDFYEKIENYFKHLKLI